jgi:hypothetical protein
MPPSVEAGLAEELGSIEKRKETVMCKAIGRFLMTFTVGLALGLPCAFTIDGCDSNGMPNVTIVCDPNNH